MTEGSNLDGCEQNEAESHCKNYQWESCGPRETRVSSFCNLNMQFADSCKSGDETLTSSILPVQVDLLAIAASNFIQAGEHLANELTANPFALPGEVPTRESWRNNRSWARD